MKDPLFPTARKNGLVIQEVPDEVLVYDMDNNKAHCLNSTAALVWRSCDGKTSVSDIAKQVAANARSHISDDLVWLAIDQLNENSLLENTIRTEFAGRSRREAIKKIGLASMVALPIVASLAAPKSAMASVSCACSPVGVPSTFCANTCGVPYCGCDGFCTPVAPGPCP